MEEKIVGKAGDISWVVGISQESHSIKVLPFIVNKSRTKIKILTDGKILGLDSEGDIKSGIEKIKKNYLVELKRIFSLEGGHPSAQKLPLCYFPYGIKGFKQEEILTEAKLLKLTNQIKKEMAKTYRDEINAKKLEQARDF